MGLRSAAGGGGVVVLSREWIKVGETSSQGAQDGGVCKWAPINSWVFLSKYNKGAQKLRNIKPLSPLKNIKGYLAASLACLFWRDATRKVKWSVREKNDIYKL